MHNSKIIACVCALVLALNATASLAATRATVGGEPATDSRRDATADSEAGAPAPVAPVAAAAPVAPQTRGRKKENIFVRIIAAPFRGLAKLFGGGRKKAARVKTQDAPKVEAASTAPAQPATVQPAPSAQAAANVQSAQPPSEAVAASAPPPVAHELIVPAMQQGTAHAPQAAVATRAFVDSEPRPASVTSAPAPAPAPPPPPGPRRVSPAEAAAAAAEQQQQAAAPFIPLIVGVPRDPLSQGRALFEQGYLTEAIAELSIAAVSGSNLVEANNLLGLAYDRRGWHRQAREYYERALSASPNDPQVLNNLGYSLYLDDRDGDALDKLKRAARLLPGAANVQNNLALVYGRLRKYDDAFRHFARAGGELYARLQTGALLSLAGRDRDAIKHFEAARRIDPASTEALRQLITLYNRTGQRDKAEAAQRELDAPKTKSASSSG